VYFFFPKYTPKSSNKVIVDLIRKSVIFSFRISLSIICFLNLINNWFCNCSCFYCFSITLKKAFLFILLCISFRVVNNWELAIVFHFVLVNILNKQFLYTIFFKSILLIFCRLIFLKIRIFIQLQILCWAFPFVFRWNFANVKSFSFGVRTSYFLSIKTFAVIFQLIERLCNSISFF
jgi:hypothetical protein